AVVGAAGVRSEGRVATLAPAEGSNRSVSCGVRSAGYRIAPCVLGGPEEVPDERRDAGVVSATIGDTVTRRVEAAVGVVCPRAVVADGSGDDELLEVDAPRDGDREGRPELQLVPVHQVQGDGC